MLEVQGMVHASKADWPAASLKGMPSVCAMLREIFISSAATGFNWPVEKPTADRIAPSPNGDASVVICSTLAGEATEGFVSLAKSPPCAAP